MAGRMAVLEGTRLSRAKPLPHFDGLIILYLDIENNVFFLTCGFLGTPSRYRRSNLRSIHNCRYTRLLRKHSVTGLGGLNSNQHGSEIHCLNPVEIKKSVMS